MGRSVGPEDNTMAVRRSKTEKNPLSPAAVLAVAPLKAAPKATAKPRAASPKTPKAAAVVLDFPAREEKVAPGHYAIRVAANSDLSVEVSIDGGEWLACRPAVGYYWFDWAPTQAGEHRIVARAKNGGPRFSKTDERVCLVVDTPAAN
ncbi:MAG: hypothetical protein HY928_16635 [Elusimicrobia bacterium]|nr:hypothetical protein [Elusimicrobiota bacterium]